MLIVGSRGSGKTNVCLELIHRMRDTFETVVICCKSKSEPLYEFLELKLGNQIQIYEGIENIPDIEEFNDHGQTLIIFDDLVLDKKQHKIEQYFIRGRKVGGGISMCYLTQSYFKAPKTIRLQCNYIILKKLSSKKDLSLILNDFTLDVDIKDLIRMYTYAVNIPNSFLLIDIESSNERFRNGFLEILGK